jgi:hypothetical protein
MHCLIQLGDIIYAFYEAFFKKSKNILRDSKTANIFNYYKMAVVNDMEAYYILLDLIAPFNVSIIPDNKLMRKLFDKNVGKAIPNLVWIKLRKFLFEDMP